MAAGDKIRLIDAGGTISSVAVSQGVLGAGSHPDGLQTLLPPQLQPLVDERVAYRGLSEEMSFQDSDRVLAAIEEGQRDPAVHGVVVAHGTDMMEEVAFLSTLMRTGNKPTLFTGSQHPPAESGFDGVANLRHAVQVAASERARNIGVAIVFAGRILDAHRVRKISSAAPDAFGPEDALLGRVDDQTVRIYAEPVPRLSFSRVLPDPNVAIVPVGLAAPAEALDLLARAPIRGIVLEAPGRGNSPQAIVDAVARAVQAGIPVLLASAAAAGGVMPIYESGERLIRAGAVAAADLDARRARLLLSYALGGGNDGAAAEALVRRYLESV